MADRQIGQIFGLAQGILADGIMNQPEAETHQDWLRANQAKDHRHVSGRSTNWSECLRKGCSTRAKVGSCTTHS